MRFVTLQIVGVSLLLACASNAFAQVNGAGFDGMAPGAYPAGGPNAAVSGGPGSVTVQPAGAAAPGVPNGAGNVLCIDTMAGGTIFVEFTFICPVQPHGICAVQYDWSGAAFSPNSGMQVHVDAGGVFNNPDDVWQPPVGLPPTTATGSNTEHAGPCDAVVHTLTFIVRPFTKIYIDNMTTTCDVGVGVEAKPWSQLKTLYR